MKLSEELRSFCGIWSDHSNTFAARVEELENRIAVLERCVDRQEQEHTFLLRSSHRMITEIEKAVYDYNERMPF